MGICLDTEQNNGSQVMESREAWRQETRQEFRYTSTPPDGQMPMHNGGNVNFEAPKVPVIFVLGGPGSGKVTHCDNLMQEKKGIVHINMTDLLQQYAIGNDMQDFSQLSSRTVTEVLMLEMKMAPNAKTYLVSGYPRSMRDVVEYSEKIQVVNGVVLISWRQKVLERQIDYGAKLGQVVLSLARMELNNFFKNVMPVADYFDQSNMLISVNGERHPGDVYKDFRAAVMRILGQQDNPPVFTNGKIAHVPQDVSTEQLPVRKRLKYPQQEPPTRPADIITVSSRELEPVGTSPVKPGRPPVLWVIGGPGSNKAALCTQTLKRNPGWAHFSVGKLLRTAAESADGRGGATGVAGVTDAAAVKQCITDGELVPMNIVIQLVETQLAANATAAGVLMDGFPRNMQQVSEFESKFKQQPHLILLDCSKLQLGRGRLDDSVSAFRRRLEIFREHSLPMLRSMDNVGRLTIVDGDTDNSNVQEDFQSVVAQYTQQLRNNKSTNDRPPQLKPSINGVLNNVNGVASRRALNGHIPDGGRDDTILHDLESGPELQTISRQVQANGNSRIGNGVANGVANGVSHMSNGFGMANGYGIPNGKAIGNGLVQGRLHELDVERRQNIKNIYNGIHVDGHI